MRTKAAELAAVEADAAVLHAKVHSEVFAVLTPEQQAKAAELKAQRQARVQQVKERVRERVQQRRQQRDAARAVASDILRGLRLPAPQVHGRPLPPP